MWILGILVVALNRGQRFYEVEVAAADTGKDVQIIWKDTSNMSKLERRQAVEIALAKLDTLP